MTKEEFSTFKRAITHNAVKFKRGQITKDEFYEALVVTLGKDTFDETIKMMDEPKPE
ncbi:MAG: hypothetical protein FWF76_04440 [Oscillospiraceae bacterium]|nr:hypothetical protein [Oscillospiraceae bacterium]